MLCSAKELGFAEDADGCSFFAGREDRRAHRRSFPERHDSRRGDHAEPRRFAQPLRSARRSPPWQGNRSVPRNAGAPPATGDGHGNHGAAECPFYSARRIENSESGRARTGCARNSKPSGSFDQQHRGHHEFRDARTRPAAHAFDADKLKAESSPPGAAGRKVSRARRKTYSSDAEQPVIADAASARRYRRRHGRRRNRRDRGDENFLLESAYFQPASVRRTARTLNLPSDASYRFERGVDPGMILRASHRAAELMREIAGATRCPGLRPRVASRDAG